MSKHRPIKALNLLIGAMIVIWALVPQTTWASQNLFSPGYWYGSVLMLPTWHQVTSVGPTINDYHFDNPSLSVGAAVGYNLPIFRALNAAIEIEYTYRSTNLSHVWVPGEETHSTSGRFRTNNLMINSQIQFPITPTYVSAYAGLGAGTAWSDRRVESIDSEDLARFEGEETSQLPALQAMTGFNLNLNQWIPRSQLMIGTRAFVEGFIFEEDRWQLSIDLGWKVAFF